MEENLTLIVAWPWKKETFSNLVRKTSSCPNTWEEISRIAAVQLVGREVLFASSAIQFHLGASGFTTKYAVHDVRTILPFFRYSTFFKLSVFFSPSFSSAATSVDNQKSPKKQGAKKSRDIFFFFVLKSFGTRWVSFLFAATNSSGLRSCYQYVRGIFFSSLNSCAPSGVIFVIFVFLNSNCCESTGFLIKDQTVFRREILFAGQFSSV